MTGNKSETWKSLSISDDIASVVSVTLGFQKITDVQEKTIPQFLAHKDVVVQAPTGSGKTLAFVIPILEILRRKTEGWKTWEVGALILSPNRELAFQIADTIRIFLENVPDKLKLMTLVGGTKLNADVENFKKNGANIIVATPGRLSDLLNRNDDAKFNLGGHLKSLEVLVLDEADRLLELGFNDSMREILARLPKQRRTGLFSATQTEALDELAKTGLRNPVYITVSSSTAAATASLDNFETTDASSKVPETLKNYATIVPAEAKFTALRSFLRQHSKEKILVFLSTCACVDYFGDLLKRLGRTKRKSSLQKDESRILTLHGKKKNKRRQIFDQFRQRESGVLICTDIMARGIDIANIDWVVQFDPPRQASWFIHRCGRTARCGRDGNALLFLTPSEEGYLEFLRRNQGVKLADMTIPYKEGLEWTTFETIRKAASKSRELLEKGTRAFVSFIQAYSKHDCRIVCSLKELDVINAAHCFGLLRLPKMPELAGRDLSGFRKCAHNTSEIPYEDKKREQARLKRLEERRCNAETPVKSTSSKDERNQSAMEEIDRPETKKQKRQRERRDLNDLNKDYKMCKRLAKGKITKEKFDEHIFG